MGVGFLLVSLQANPTRDPPPKKKKPPTHSFARILKLVDDHPRVATSGMPDGLTASILTVA